jgi:CheY-like chemotaxis protein
MDRNCHIYIADDDVDDLQLIQFCLKTAGYSRVTVFKSGSDLLNHLYASKPEELPDLIISDLNMPRISGIQLIKTLKGKEDLKHIPVYIITTDESINTQKECKKHGAIGCFTKPCELNCFVSLLKSIVTEVDRCEQERNS